MKKLIEKYGLINCILVFICAVALVINSLFVEESALLEISDNTVLAYILNFLVGCQGVLGKFGSMSYEKVFVSGQWWRCVTHIYLHTGVIHMIMNMVALLVSGKYIEKKYGSMWYVLFFHVTAIADAIIVSLIFPSESVGASAGIFAVIGVFVVLLFKKRISPKKSEMIYLLIFSILSLMLGIESLVIHLLAFLFGIIVGVIVLRKNREQEV